MKKLPIILLLLSSLLFSYSYGPASYLVEKTWHFDQQEGSEIGKISFYDFYFLANNSYQNVTIINSSPGLVFTQRIDGIVVASYNGTMPWKTGDLSVSAYVDVYYDPKIATDYSFTTKQLSSTNLTTVTPEMKTKAESLSDKSSVLGTIRNLTDFVYHYVTYDSSYRGKLIPAQQVYSVKKGVCAEYAHLFIALARAIGLETKYIYGQIVDSGSSFDTHAWAAVDVPGYGLLYVDPTYLQMGRLDNSHIIETIGEDNNLYLGLYYSSGNVLSNYSINIKMLKRNDLAYSPITGKCSYVDANRTVFADLKNNENVYVVFPYYFAVDDAYGGSFSTLGIFPPKTEQTFAYRLNASTFKQNYYYTIPTLITIYDYDICEGFTIYTDTMENNTPKYVTYTNNNSQEVNYTYEFEERAPICLSSLLLLLPLFTLIFYQSTTRNN